jgi:signal peptidase I
MKRWLGLAGGLSIGDLLLCRRCCTVVTVRGHSMNFWTAGGTGTRGDPNHRIKRIVAAGGEPRPEMFADSTLPAVIPDGQLAVAGDNAERSQDSRHLGYIPLSAVVGRVRIRRR